MRSALSLALASLLLVSAVASVPTAATAATGFAMDRSPTADATDAASEHDACERFATGDPPADPESDRLGWENGCWSNESLAVTTGDGLNETELDAVIARSMARVEVIREREFEKAVPVDIVSHEAYTSEIENLTGNVTTEDRLHQNAKWEAMFVLNEDEDAISAQRSNFANGTAGFYDPDREQIRIVSADPASAPVDELTLGHELVHALQDQHFNTSYNRTTVALDHAIDGIVEGDADYVEARYSDRCDADWDCSSPPSNASAGGSVNVGLQVNTLVPYSEGSAFVQHRFEEGGWDAVDEVYENPPDSTEQVIHPRKYPDEAPANVSIDHSPSGDWRVLDLPGGVNYASFGEGGLYTMLWYASFESTRDAGAISNVVIPYQHFFNFPLGQEPPGIAPYNYSHPVTEGWAGDRLVPYVTDESAETGETGYVWKFAWDSPEDAEEFHGAYLDLLEYRGAEPVDGREGTYRIPEGTEFADAFYVTREGDTVTVVNGPTVEDLGQIREGAAPTDESATATETPTDAETDTPVPTPTDTPAPTDTATETDAATEDASNGTSDGTATGGEPVANDDTTADGPGFGVLLALVAVLALAVATGRRTEQ